MNNLLFLATDHGLITIERSRDRWIERFRALNEIHANDGQHNVMPDARSPLGGKEVPCRGAEERAYLVGVRVC